MPGNERQRADRCTLTAPDGRFAGRGGRLLGAAFLTLLITGCRIVITVPEGGRVVTDNGITCLSGETCVLDVNDTSFDEIFRALPDNGYTFTQWRRASAHFCGGNTAPCQLATHPIAGVPALEAILYGDYTFYLSPEFAPDDGRYDLTAWQQLISGLNSSSYRSSNFLYQVVPNASNCDPGVLRSQATQRFLETVNLIRKLHYLPEVAYDSSRDVEMQQTALVQLANGYLTHYPAPSDQCYSSAAATGAGTSNLSASSQQRDPASLALGWVKDNYNISAVMEAGHRRWVLHPALGYTSYGQAGGFSAMKVFGFGQSSGTPIPPELEYVAYPYLDFPYLLLEKGSAPTPWGISMVPPQGVSSRFDHFSGASVSVTEVASGNALTVHSLHSDTRGYGLANFLSWMVDGWQYDTSYRVTISNVRMQDSSVRTVSYPVKIDYAGLQAAP